MNAYIIDYHYGTYSGEQRVIAEDGEQAIAKMWARFRRDGLLTLPMASQGAKVIRVEPLHD